MSAIKKIIIAVSSLVFVLILSTCTYLPSAAHYKTINLNGQSLQVEIADTARKQSQGLSNRQFMPADHGMLFIFDDYIQPNFWMKDMQFPIDIIWIKDYYIIGITKKVSVEKNNQILKIYHPPQPINYVLEVNAGWADKHHIKIGDELKF